MVDGFDFKNFLGQNFNPPNIIRVDQMENIKRIQRDMARDKARREEREEENLRLLREINGNLSRNLTNANQTLDSILISIGANFQKTQRELNKNNTLLEEAKEILEELKRDSSSGKLMKFMTDHGIEAFAALLQVLSMILNQG